MGKKKESFFFQKWISNFGFKNLSQSFKMNFCSKIVQIQLSFFSTCMDNFFLMMPYNSVSQNFCTMQRVGFVSEFQRKDGNPHTSFTSTKRWQSKHANTSFFSHNFEAKIKIADAFFFSNFFAKMTIQSCKKLFLFDKMVATRWAKQPPTKCSKLI